LNDPQPTQQPAQSLAEIGEKTRIAILELIHDSRDENVADPIEALVACACEEAVLVRCVDLVKCHDEFQKLYQKALAELQQLRADKERLDWMEKLTNFEYVWNYKSDYTEANNGCPCPIRQAIDDARKETGK